MRTLLSILTMSIALSGCGVFSGAGNDLGSGFVEAVGQQDTTLMQLVDSLVATAGRTGSRQALHLRDSLLGERTRELVAALEDDLSRASIALRDSLIGPKTRQWILDLEREILDDLLTASTGLRENLTGEQTRRRLAVLRDELLGVETALFVAAMRDTLIGPEMRRQIDLLRDDLLGAETREALDSLLVTAADRLKAVTREEEGFLKKHITEILWTAGGIVALLLILGSLLMLREKKYKRMLELLTVQIHRMPDRTSYDELTDRVRSRAQETGIEPKLREFLAGHGILGLESWKRGTGS